MTLTELKRIIYISCFLGQKLKFSIESKINCLRKIEVYYPLGFDELQIIDVRYNKIVIFYIFINKVYLMSNTPTKNNRLSINLHAQMSTAKKDNDIRVKLKLTIFNTVSFENNH